MPRIARYGATCRWTTGLAVVLTLVMGWGATAAASAAGSAVSPTAEPAVPYLLEMERVTPEAPAIATARAMLARGAWQDAVDALAPVILAGSSARTDDRAHGLMLAAVALAGLGDRARAAALLDEAAAMRPASLVIRLNRARLDWEAGRDAQAAQALERIGPEVEARGDAELRAWVGALWYRLGAQAAGRGDVDEALRRWERAWHADPASALYPLHYASLAKSAGRLQQAAGAYDAAIEHLGAGADASVLVEAGLVHLALRRYEQALSLFERVRAQRPRDAEALYGAGVALTGLGRLQEAAARLREAVEAHPGHWRARLALGTALMATGATDEAVRHFEEAVRLAPAVAESRIALGQAYLEAGRPRDAEGQLQAGLALGEARPEVLYAIGQARLMDGRPRDAAASFAAAASLETTPVGKALSLYAQALATEAAGDVTAAIGLLRQAVSLDSSRFDAHLRLGELLLASGDAEAAMVALRTAASLRPDDARVQRALESARSATAGG
ncbi:MAG: tetratricopeptide repeat protein [Firmicutes bacterium]|nr:tetratricopeptide repeat protein [Bacillota bacterium]